MFSTMMRSKIGAVIFCVLWAVAGIAQAAADRVALVIGNTEYKAVTPLQNAGNDAEGVAAALREIGFEVDVKLDLTNGQLSDAFRQFHRKSTGAKIAIVYYAGHGIEIEKSNYLIPVDAVLERTADVYFEAVPMENAMLAVEGASELSLVILDACRNNPFAANIRQSGGTRSVGRGLALVEPTGNSLVAYAAKGGTTAFDGDGENSPYAEALMEALREPDVELSLLFRKVRDRVLETTNGEQEPFVYGSLSAKELFLNSSGGAAKPEKPTDTVEPNVQVAHNSQQFNPAFVTWTAIQTLDRGPQRQRALRAFIEEFGDSPFAGSARVMLRSYEDDAEKPSDRAAETNKPVLTIVEPQVDKDDPTQLAALDTSATGADVPLSRTERRLVQRGLSASGYPVGSFDGIFGARTRAAIVSWQDSQSYRVTSYLGQDQADELMELGRKQKASQPVAVATPQAVSPSGNTPTNDAATTQAKDTVVASIAPKPSTTSATQVYLDLRFSFKEDGREVNKSWLKPVALSGGRGQFKAKFSDIGKFGPFTIDLSVSNGVLSYSGQIVQKSFAGSGNIIGGNVSKNISIIKGGIRYRLTMRAVVS